MSKPSGLMPNRATREALEQIDTSVRGAIWDAVASGVLPAKEAEERARKMHIASADALFRMLDRHRELSRAAQTNTAG